MITKELLIELLKQSVEKCYAQDMALIERSMEQASVARIFYYMQRAIDTEEKFEELQEYNLDCEYNKNGEEIKFTERCPKGTKPDLILHKRGENASNLLVVEFKANCARDRQYRNFGKSKDIIKLEDFTNGAIYNYFLGVFVKLSLGRADYQYFQNGQLKEEKELHDEPYSEFN